MVTFLISLAVVYLYGSTLSDNFLWLFPFSQWSIYFWAYYIGWTLATWCVIVAFRLFLPMIVAVCVVCIPPFLIVGYE